MTDNLLEPDDQAGAAAAHGTASVHSPEDSSEETGNAGQGARSAVSTKLLAVIGAVLLVIGAVTWIIGLASVKGFSEDDPTAVKADQSYYLLASKDALDATACGFFGPGGTPIHNKVKEVEDLTGEDHKIKDVSLPFSTRKGVYARVEFTDDVQGAHIECNAGDNYITTKSAGALNALRWISMLGVGAGIALLVSAAVLRGRADGQPAGEGQATVEAQNI